MPLNDQLTTEPKNRILCAVCGREITASNRCTGYRHPSGILIVMQEHDSREGIHQAWRQISTSLLISGCTRIIICDSHLPNSE